MGFFLAAGWKKGLSSARGRSRQAGRLQVSLWASLAPGRGVAGASLAAALAAALAEILQDRSARCAAEYPTHRPTRELSWATTEMTTPRVGRALPSASPGAVRGVGLGLAFSSPAGAPACELYLEESAQACGYARHPVWTAATQPTTPQRQLGYGSEFLFTRGRGSLRSAHAPLSRWLSTSPGLAARNPPKHSSRPAQRSCPW